MNSNDIMAILPVIITAYAGVVLMILAAFRASNKICYAVSLLSIAAAFGGLFIAKDYAPRLAAKMLVVDDFSLVISGLLIAAVFVIAMLSYDYLQTRQKPAGAFYIMLLFALSGMMTIAASGHFVAFFLGLEILSASLYGLVAYIRDDKLPLEASMKYLVLAAASSAFLLFGIAMIYFETGTMSLAKPFHVASSPVFLMGLAMVLVGFGFKLAIVPFHLWSPDVYQGAPAPISALIVTCSKGAVLALLLRFVINWNLLSDSRFVVLLTALSIVTMFTGNFLALKQGNIKRLLAYSSIAHVGYLLIALLARNASSGAAVAFYLISYFATTIAAFGVVSHLSGKNELENVSEYQGLGKKHAFTGAVLAISMLSLTGIPLTSGFIAKSYVFSAAAGSSLWLLLIIGVINSGISAYYYLRVVTAIYSEPVSESNWAPGKKLSSLIALTVCLAVMLILAVYPGPALEIAQMAARSLGL